MLEFDFEQARRFVEALTGHEGTEIIIQTADDKTSKRKDLVAVLGPKPLADLWDGIKVLNASGAGIWIQINAGRRGARNVTAVRAYFIDDDGKAPTRPQYAVPPNILVKSSAGVRNEHAYYLAQPGEAIEQFTPMQRHLIAYYGSDAGIHNLDRVMRLPGTYNMKRAEPFLVTMTHCVTMVRHSVASLTPAHPLPEAAQQALKSEVFKEEYTAEQLSAAQRVAGWLTERHIAYVAKSPIRFVLRHCPFNPDHEDSEIRVQSRGGYWWGCFHETCGSNRNRWAAFKDRIGGWHAAESFTRGDDVEVAHRLLAVLSSESEVVSTGDAIWCYDEDVGIWSTLDTHRGLMIISEFAGSKLGEKRTLKMSKPAAKNALEFAKSISSPQPKFFEESAPGIAFANGFLTVASGGVAFIPKSAENRQRFGLPFDYAADSACPNFLAFLRSCFAVDSDCEEKIGLLQEFIGACLIGRATSFEKALVLYGPSASNGKSQFLKIVRALFPPSSVISIAPQEFNAEYSRARLLHARVNLVDEMPEANIIASEAFKAIITGNEVSARNLYESQFDVKPRCGHIFSANKLPATNDQTNGFWRRVLVVSWNRTFEGSPERVQDIADRILATDLAGIALWAAQGAVRAIGRGSYVELASSTQAKAEWRRDTDPVAAFDNDNLDHWGETPATKVFRAFKFWARENNFKELSRSTFRRRMIELGLRPREKTAGTFYPVTLRVEVEELMRGYMS